MITITTNNKSIKLYASIKELPITRYKLMQSYILQDAGIGSTIEDVDKRMNNIMMFAASAKTDDVVTEVTNLRYTFFSMLSKIDYLSKSFACLIAGIDDVEKNDLSSEGLTELVNEVSFMPRGELQDHWEEVKKNWITN